MRRPVYALPLSVLALVAVACIAAPALTLAGVHSPLRLAVLGGALPAVGWRGGGGGDRRAGPWGAWRGGGGAAPWGGVGRLGGGRCGGGGAGMGAGGGGKGGGGGKEQGVGDEGKEL